MDSSNPCISCCHCPSCPYMEYVHEGSKNQRETKQSPEGVGSKALYLRDTAAQGNPCSDGGLSWGNLTGRPKGLFPNVKSFLLEGVNMETKRGTALDRALYPASLWMIFTVNLPSPPCPCSKNWQLFLHLLGPALSSPCLPRTFWGVPWCIPWICPHQSSRCHWVHRELPQLEQQKHPELCSTGQSWHIVQPLPAAFSPCLSLLGISGLWLQRWHNGARDLHVTSLNVHPTHPCITALPLLALLTPRGMAHVDMFGEALGCEAEGFHKQLHQPCRARAEQHQQMAWSPCVLSWT